MACLRGISKKVNLFPRRLHPSFGHLIGTDDDNTKSGSPNSGLKIHKVLPDTGTDRLSSVFRNRQYASLAWPVGFCFSSSRYMSSKPSDSEWSDKVDGIDSVTEEVISDKTVEAVASQVPAMNEVAVAAADSAVPVAALQYLIDGVHSFTGLNWWSSIVLTTLMIRGFTIPLLLNQLKATSKLNMLRPRLEEIRHEIRSTAMDPEAMAEGQKRMQALFNEYGVTPFTPLKGLLIQGPIFISFFFAIRNMAEKVPSFKIGGTLWFTNLTIPDSSYILPLLTALTFLITVEEGLEGNPVAGTMKKFSRILAVISVPVMISFEQALFCYWLTSNLFSLAYGLAIRRAEVKRFLNLRDVPISPTKPSQSTPVPTRTISSFSQFKRDTEVQEKTPAFSEPSNFGERRISRNSVLSQRIRTLEKLLKGRKSKR